MERVEPIRYVEMPERVERLELVDGALMVRLEDGRIIDMTDWFKDQSDRPN